MGRGPLGAGLRGAHWPTPAYCMIGSSSQSYNCSHPSPLPLGSIQSPEHHSECCPALDTVTAKEEMLTVSYCKFK